MQCSSPSNSIVLENPLTGDSIDDILSRNAWGHYGKYDNDGALAELEEAIRLQREVLKFRPEGHPGRSQSLNDLAVCLACKFNSQKSVSDLEEAISHHRAALELRPVDHPYRSQSLNNLASCFALRFDSQRSAADLEEAISCHRAALKLRSVDHPDRYQSLLHLALCLQCRFNLQQSMDDLEEAIFHHRAVLGLHSANNSHRSVSLDNLAICLEHRFDLQNSMADLEEATSLHRAALELRSVGHPHRSQSLHNLATCLVRRFDSQKSVADLEEAISYLHAAVELCPVDSPDQCHVFDTLAVCLRHKFDLQKAISDLEDAISHLQNALELCSVDYSGRPLFLNNLAGCLECRFDLQKAVTDLNEAISHLRTALNHCPIGHPLRPESLRNIASCLEKRFGSQGAVSDLNEVIIHRRALLETCVSEQSDDLIHLANSLEARFKLLATVADFDEAVRIRQHLSDLCFPAPSDPPESINITHPGHTTDGDTSHAKRVVLDVVQKILKTLPPRLIDVHTGTLCDRARQLSDFEATSGYYELLASFCTHKVIQQSDIDHIRATATRHFRYVMLSHRWGKGEPLLHQIEGRNIYEISDEDMLSSDGLKKLKNFCNIARDAGYSWAWSDTCCIDKTSSVELQHAIGSMFSWYQRSALTTVHLSDVAAASPLSTLFSSVWFRRGWTLQELLAPQQLLFYSQDWSLCMPSPSSDHKSNPDVQRALERTTGISTQHLTKFRPGMEDARLKLQWASDRITTWPEDIAYSLFGIFDLHLPILYGEGEEKALVRLLREITSESGDVSIMDWVGKASSYHSTLPASMECYRSPRTTQWMMREIDLERHKYRARQVVNAEDAHKLYDALAALPLPQFTNRRVTLPCIIYGVKAVKYERKAIYSHVYDIQATGLRPLTIASSTELKAGSENNASRYILEDNRAALSVIRRTLAGGAAPGGVQEDRVVPYHLCPP